MITWEPAFTPKGRHRHVDGYPVWIPTVVCDSCGARYKFTGRNGSTITERTIVHAQNGSFEYGATTYEARFMGPEGIVFLELDLCLEPCSLGLYDQFLQLGAKRNAPRYSVEYARSEEGYQRGRELRSIFGGKQLSARSENGPEPKKG